MQFASTVTQKGQATIPVAIRRKLGIKLNTKIVFEINNKNEAVIKPVVDFFSLKGSVKSQKPFDIKAMDRAVGKMISQEYAKKPH